MNVEVMDRCIHVEQAIRSAIKTSVASSWHFISTYRYYVKIGRTESVTSYTSLIQYLEVQRKKKWLSDSDICVGDVSIRKLEDLFKLTPKVL
jgi:hypothetical protein